MQGWKWMTMAGLAALATGCTATAADQDALQTRAYVVSERSDELFAVDYGAMAAVGSVDTSLGDGANQNHMAVVTPDGGKVYVAATAHDAIVVVDAATLSVTKRIDVGARPTHMGLRPNGAELWVVNEDSASISVIDTEADEVHETITHDSFLVPHFVRFAADAAYVPSIGGNQISVVDLEGYEVTEVIGLEDRARACTADPCGFADAQIDADGILVAAHIQSGKVLSYDTTTRTRLGTIDVGQKPWAVFVGGVVGSPGPAMMPNWDDASVSVLNRDPVAEVARTQAGGRESYGVNFSALVPDEAFVLSRFEHRVNVVGRASGELLDAIAVGGTTETAATTADGRYLLVPVSSAGALAVIDVTTRDVVARFADVGDHPWSVTTVGGQNYCH